jgi:hypothetical protein
MLAELRLAGIGGIGTTLEMPVSMVRFILIGAAMLTGACASGKPISQGGKNPTKPQSGEGEKGQALRLRTKPRKPENFKGPELEVTPSGDLVPVIGRDKGLQLF